MSLFGPPDVDKLKAKGDIKGLIKALGYQRDWQVRVSAARALGEIGDARAVEALIGALGEQHADMRKAAAEALGKIGDARAVEPLVAALKDEQKDVRLAATEALRTIGAPAVEPLTAALKARKKNERLVAIAVLGKIGDARAVEPLAGALKDRAWSVRRAAAEALGGIGDARAVEPLVAALKDEQENVRTAAAEALSKLGRQPDETESDTVPRTATDTPAVSPPPASAPAVITSVGPAPEPGTEARVVRVFVSSTFRDMAAERDELVKRTFPALRSLCEARGVTWGEVDLRWGVTDEQAAEGQVLPICLAEIRGCRPYFIGLLGERYGWVPEALDPALVEQEPWLAAQAGRSVTELEILHGVLNEPAMATHTFFYLRDPAYVADRSPDQYSEVASAEEIAALGAEAAARKATEREAKLAALKERLRASGLPLREDYPDPQALGELVLADLTAVIEQRFPAGSAPHPLEREAAEHEAFAASRSGVYIGRADYFSRLDAHAAGEEPPLVVVGESGGGKSALLANWALQYRASHADELVLLHFIGASPASTDWAAMVRRLMGELAARLGFEIEVPDDPGALRLAFAGGLHRAAAKGRVVLVIDAVNQLEDREGALDLAWLPPVIPANVRLVLSTLPGRSLAAIEGHAYPALAVEPLEAAERERLIVDYLASYTKALDPALRERLASSPQCANPLYLRALLDELRLWGEHETLGARIEHYLAAPTVDALYELILARYEQDYERERPALVRDAFALLWAARRGLSESELLDLLGSAGEPLPRAHWSPLFLAAASALTSRSGLLGFFHDYLRQAVAHRYLGDEQAARAAHLRLADYFAARELSARQIDELPWQLARAQAWQRLFELLADTEFLEVAWHADRFEVQAAWAQVETGSELRMLDAYGLMVKAHARLGMGPAVIFPYPQVFIVATLFSAAGHPEEALPLLAYLAGRCRHLGDAGSLQNTLNSAALTLRALGDVEGAMALLKEAEQICREHGDSTGLAMSLSNQASIIKTRGDLDGAMALFEEAERICRELGDLDGLHVALGGQGVIIVALGDLDGAMALFKEDERICRELGDLDGLQVSLGNRAVNLEVRGDLDGAMALQEEKERICRELGDAANLQACLGNQGIILRERGDLDGAMALHKEEERICRELGDAANLQASLNNQALILKVRGDLDGAMALFKEVEQSYRTLADPEGLAISLANQASILGSAPGWHQAALPLAEEAYRLASQHGLASLAQQIRPLLNRLQGGG